MPTVKPSTHRHIQDVASTTWDIAHNMGGNGGQGLAIVDTLIDIDGTLVKSLPLGVEIVDANNVRITFSAPQSGVAIVIV